MPLIIPNNNNKKEDKRMFAIAHHVSIVPTFPHAQHIQNNIFHPLPPPVPERESTISSTHCQYYSQKLSQQSTYYPLFHPRNLGKSRSNPTPPSLQTIQERMKAFHPENDTIDWTSYVVLVE